MKPTSYRWMLWLTVWATLSLGTPIAAAEEPPRPVGLEEGQAAPWTGVLLPRSQAEDALTALLEVGLTRISLQQCREAAARAPHQVAEAVPPCPTAETPPTPSPWPDRLAGAAGGAVLSLLLVLGLVLAS